MKLLLAFVLAVFTIEQVFGQNPEIVDEIWPEVQRVGGTARLNCTVAWLNANTVEWTRVTTSELISSGETIVVKNDFMHGSRKYEVQVRTNGDRVTYMLVIRRLLQQDAGSYQCQVKIQSVSPLRWPKKLSSITVQEKPQISDLDTSSDMSKNAEDPARLECYATGRPTPLIKWTRMAGKLLPSGGTEFQGNELVISRVQADHAGIYKCTAENSAGVDSREIRLTVS